LVTSRADQLVQHITPETHTHTDTQTHGQTQKTAVAATVGEW